MSRAEEAILATVLVFGDPVAALGQSTFVHHVSEGEYIFEMAVIAPYQSIICPTWVSIEFIPDYVTDRQRNIWLGWGFAASDKFPLIVRGPVPLTGPGYFLVSGESSTTNDRVEGTFSYRKVKFQ